MEKWPKISIIIPIYNVEDYLSRCLDSVIQQTLLDIEIIGVNDGSKDKSLDILKHYASMDSRIKVIDKANGGVASARNAGLAEATGERIMFLDPDDYLESCACERVYEEHLNYGADIIVFGSSPFPEIPEPDPWIRWNLASRDRYYETFDPEALFNEPGGNPFIWNKSFRRAFLVEKGLRFDEDVLFGEDITFVFKSMPQAGSIQFISQILHFYQCYRPGSLMNQYDKELEYRIERHVVNARDITDFWARKGYLKKWRVPFCKWYFTFTASDIVKFKPANKKKLERAIFKTVEDYHMLGRGQNMMWLVKKLLSL